MRRLDTGSLPAFGDLTAVFNTSHVRNAVVIAAYDSWAISLRVAARTLFLVMLGSTVLLTGFHQLPYF